MPSRVGKLMSIEGYRKSLATKPKYAVKKPPQPVGKPDEVAIYNEYGNEWTIRKKSIKATGTGPAIPNVGDIIAENRKRKHPQFGYGTIWPSSLANMDPFARSGFEESGLPLRELKLVPNTRAPPMIFRKVERPDRQVTGTKRLPVVPGAAQAAHVNLHKQVGVKKASRAAGARGTSTNKDAGSKQPLRRVL